MSSLEKPFRTGRTAAKRAAKEQRELIQKQKMKDEADLAEAESELAEKRRLAKTGQGGRSLLINPNATGAGKATNLGGTV